MVSLLYVYPVTQKKGGICIAFTGSAIVIGTYNEDKNQVAGGCNIAVENLADFLRSSGY